jgi:hypothetical protein
VSNSFASVISFVAILAVHINAPPVRSDELAVTINTVNLRPNTAYIFEKFNLTQASETAMFAPGKYRVLPIGDANVVSSFTVDDMDGAAKVTVLSNPMGYLSASGSTLTVTGRTVILYLNALHRSAYVHETGVLNAGENIWGLIPGNYHIHTYGPNKRTASFSINGSGQIGISDPSKNHPFLEISGNSLRLNGSRVGILTPTHQTFRLESIVHLNHLNLFKLLPGSYDLKHINGQRQQFRLLPDGTCDKKKLIYENGQIDLDCAP